MKYLLSICLILLSFGAWAQCFQAIQDGQPVEVICTGKPVFFRDCTANPDPEAVIFYYPGPGSFDPQNYNPNDLLEGEEQITLTTADSYTITQIINRQGGGGTTVFAKTYEVKDAPAPAFSYTRCANSNVSFTVTDTNYDSYTLDFGDGTTATAPPGGMVTHQYTAQADYTVTLTGTNTGSNCSNSSSQTITVLPQLDQDNPTQITKLTVLEEGTSGSVQLELSGLVPGYSYTIERYTGNFRNPFEEVNLIQEVTSSTLTQTVRNVDTSEGTWYLVRPVDACGQVFINSNIVSALALSVQAVETEVNLSWEFLPDFQNFEVYRNGALLQTLSGGTQTYTDTDVTCNQTYSYYVVGVGVDPEGDRYSAVSVTKSAEVSSTAIPEAPYLLASFNLNNQVELSLELPQGEQLQTAVLERSVNGRPFTSLGRSQQGTYTDAEINLLQPNCYRASFTNACGNSSAFSNEACPILLQAERQNDGSVSLSWSAYRGFPTAVGQYTVELLDEAGNIVNSYPATGLNYTDITLSDELPVLRYRIRATSQNNNGITYSNLAVVEQDVLVFIPSAFTPNGDGLNDTFEIKGKFFTGYTLRVYNRLGNVIFQGTEADPAWDGTQNGRDIIAGAYAYEITLQTRFGTTKRRTGTITLLR